MVCESYLSIVEEGLQGKEEGERGRRRKTTRRGKRRTVDAFDFEQKVGIYATIERDERGGEDTPNLPLHTAQEENSKT